MAALFGDPGGGGWSGGGGGGRISDQFGIFRCWWLPWLEVVPGFECCCNLDSSKNLDSELELVLWDAKKSIGSDWGNETNIFPFWNDKNHKMYKVTR